MGDEQITQQDLENYLADLHETAANHFKHLRAEIQRLNNLGDQLSLNAADKHTKEIAFIEGELASIKADSTAMLEKYRTEHSEPVEQHQIHTSSWRTGG